ncbi:MAG: hemerythrin domain-containing protein [Gammaproteobacteria bacterium]|nr:hemerythrin domain-containing protein [Gammaproteobacteria bacterium]
MTTVAHLRESHAELTEMIQDLEAGLTRENLSIRANAKAMHKLLCDLAEKVRAHLGEEDKEMYPHQSELRKEFEAYYKKWLKDCDFNFTDAFLTETRGIITALVARIEREEKVLFPKLEEMGMFVEEKKRA